MTSAYPERSAATPEDGVGMLRRMTTPAAVHPTVITGAASGIGRALALRLAAAGRSLVLIDRSAEQLAETVALIRARTTSTRTRGTIATYAIDVTSEADVRDALRDAAGADGALAAVVHCAGILRTGLFSEIAPADHRSIAMVNVWGSFNVASAAIPLLTPARGRLIFMGSSSAFWGPPEFASYGASKAAVFNLAQALRIELEDDGVAVGVCNPLFVESPMLQGANRDAHFVASEGIEHTVDDVAAALERGLDSRVFDIWVGRGPRRIYRLSRYLAPLGHRLMARAFRRARAAQSAQRARTTSTGGSGS